MYQDMKDQVEKINNSIKLHDKFWGIYGKTITEEGVGKVYSSVAKDCRLLADFISDNGRFIVNNENLVNRFVESYMNYLKKCGDELSTLDPKLKQDFNEKVTEPVVELLANAYTDVARECFYNNKNLEREKITNELNFLEQQTQIKNIKTDVDFNKYREILKEVKSLSQTIMEIKKNEDQLFIVADYMKNKEDLKQNILNKSGFVGNNLLEIALDSNKTKTAVQLAISDYDKEFNSRKNRHINLGNN